MRKTNIEKEAWRRSSIFSPNIRNNIAWNCHKLRVQKKLEEFNKRPRNEKWEIFVEWLGRVK